MGTANSKPVTPVDIAAAADATYHPDCGYRLYNDDFGGRVNGLPTTCFGDVILAPLPTWVLLGLLALVLLPAVILSRRRSSGASKAAVQRFRYRRSRTDDYEGKAGSYGDDRRGFTSRVPWLWSVLSVIFQILVVCALLMNILQLVRLILAHRGAGLIPFQLAGIVIVFILYQIPYTRKVRTLANGIILIFWVLCLALTAVRVAIYKKLLPVEPRTNTEYHLSDELIDTETMLGLYSLFTAVELLRFSLNLLG